MKNCSVHHGFRFSWLDAFVLTLAAVGTVWLRTMGIDLWWVLPMVVGHFFLFCNVFLVWRKYEFIWAAIFVLNVSAHVLLGMSEWLPACAWQLPVTLMVVLMQIRSPWYHGIAAEKLNPRLDQYLNARRQHDL